MIEKKRAQAAFEFLSTYVWAILVILIVVGGLYYLGVFNVQVFIPQTCSLDSSIACPSYSLQKNSTSSYNLRLRLENAQSNAITITGIKIKEANADLYCTSSKFYELSTMNEVSSSRLGTSDGSRAKDYLFVLNKNSNCPDFVTSGLDSGLGSKKQYDIQLIYLKGDSTRHSTSSGKMVLVSQDLT